MKNSGLSVLEILIGLGLLSVFIVMSLIFSQSINHSSENGRVQATRDRLILRVRNVCGMAAALRNSIKAALPSGTTSINQDLNNCVTGAQGAVCQNNQVYPLTLFSPTLEMDSFGNPMGLLPVTSPPGSPTPSYYDIFGAACAQGSPNCFFIITTTFQAQCPPAPLPLAPPPTSDPTYLSFFTPMNTCTVAESINVTYTVDVDPAAAAANPALAGLIQTATGTVTTSAKLIFGNDPR